MRRTSGNDLVAQNASPILLGAGTVFIVAGVLVSRDAVSVPLVVIGAATIILGAVLSRAEGQVKIGPGGLEVVLGAVRRKTDELPAEKRDAVLAASVRDLLDIGVGGIPSAEAFGTPEVTAVPSGERAAAPAVSVALLEAFGEGLVSKNALKLEEESKPSE
jgi:hypothetical protein